jgi:hypothetical protein
MATEEASKPKSTSGGRRARHVMHRDAVEDASNANPLRTGTRLERVPDPSIVVVFGATGDLSHRKIFPAFYNLRRAGLLPLETSIVGYSRRAYSDHDFAAEMREAVAEHSRNPVEQALWDDFAETIHYQQGDFTDPAAYARLAERLDQIDAAAGCRGNRLFYLATPPSAYEDIVSNLGSAGLANRDDSWSRIVIEKPFGYDLESGHQLNDAVMIGSAYFAFGRILFLKADLNGVEAILQKMELKSQDSDSSGQKEPSPSHQHF